MKKFKFKSNILNLSINIFFIIFFIIFSILIKMSKSLSRKYYQENKKRLQWKARGRYQNLSKEKKKWQYGLECYKNLSED